MDFKEEKHFYLAFFGIIIITASYFIVTVLKKKYYSIQINYILSHFESEKLKNFSKEMYALCALEPTFIHSYTIFHEIMDVLFYYFN